MAHAVQKKGERIKKDPSVLKCPDKNAVRTGHVVCITNVPSALCVSERTVRDLFAEYGMLLSVTIHHNLLDMKPDGFMYLEYAEKTEAEAAVTAVKDKRVGLAAQLDVTYKRAVASADITGMNAVMAMSRGKPTCQVNESIRDILLGNLELNRFTQSQHEQTMNDDDLILQSLSQHSFTSSQPKRKKKHRNSVDSMAKRPKSREI
ncbi:hypothetical protein CCR75_007106 [Bremia lactucae]|uniref:RRM domain-containing protein n=1 Tax=Bremia lactucae TaxID=4779 RepID=A0A976IG33_BRELC|nr:hypothetical protein CCR75_007106 [Bremia lactucae]